MGIRIGGKEVEGIIIREEGAIANAKESHKKNPRYVEQQLGKIKKVGLAVGILSADSQDAVELRFEYLFGERGGRLVAIAVGEVAIDAPRDELSALLLTTAAGMAIPDSPKLAVFSPFDSDLIAADMVGMIRIRTGPERTKWDDACADNLTSALALIDFDKADLPSNSS